MMTSASYRVSDDGVELAHLLAREVGADLMADIAHIAGLVIAGLALSFAISSGFWAGLGLLVARTVK